MNTNDYLNQIFGKNTNSILDEIRYIRSLGMSFNFTVSEYKKFDIALRNAELLVKKNSAFLNFIFKNQNFYLFSVFKSFLLTGNKLDTFEEYYTKCMQKDKTKISQYGIQFFKLYQQSFEHLYQLATSIKISKTIVATKMLPK
jgi:hypothetical protein